MTQTRPQPLSLRAPAPLRGTIGIPGDKSISHRALILGSLAVGETRIHGLLESEDTARTAAAMRAMGASVARTEDGIWVVHGVGVGSLLQPETVLEMGNSGTSTRLLMGLVASHPLKVMFAGDPSLSKRPMQRVIEPLQLAGAEFSASQGDRLPLVVRGLSPALPIRYRLPVASAQVKSAILLSGLNIPGETVVEEPVPSRDHTERMLEGFGARIWIEEEGGVRTIHLTGPAELVPQQLTVPGDISSAAFPLVAGLIVDGSVITIEGVSVNPTRSGILRVLKEMDANITIGHERLASGEPVADLRVEASALRGVVAPPEIAPSMIDEYPILFVAAACARGRTVIRGIGELRVKESDRIALMAKGLKACGVAVEELPDGIIIEGKGPESITGGAAVDPELDHRIAMSFAVLSLVARAPVTISDQAPIATSFPGFLSLMQSLGAENCSIPAQD